MATGKSEKQQVIAFIDYENCSNLTEISLNIYTELIIFAGAKQNNVALPVNAFPEAVKITLRHVSEVSRNNVDFHLVLELGQCVCHYGPEKEYHIVSADKGYDGIICFSPKVCTKSFILSDKYCPPLSECTIRPGCIFLFKSAFSVASPLLGQKLHSVV